MASVVVPCPSPNHSSTTSPKTIAPAVVNGTCSDFSQLTLDVILLICSRLKAKDIVALSHSSSYFLNILQSHVAFSLWKIKLSEKLQDLQCLNERTDSILMKYQVDPRKSLLALIKPRITNQPENHDSFIPNFTAFLRKLHILPQTKLPIVWFGMSTLPRPSCANGLFRDILWDPSSPFETTGVLYPGMGQVGFGAGLGVKFRAPGDNNMFTDRGPVFILRELKLNRPRYSSNNNEIVDQYVSMLFDKNTNFVYVIEGSKDVDEDVLRSARRDLQKFLYSSREASLLILLAIPSKITSRHSVAKVAEALRLNDLKIARWLVQVVPVDEFKYSIKEGFLWLSKHSLRQ